MSKLKFGSLILMILTGCQVSVSRPQPTASPTPSAMELRWYSSCGDPVCGRPNASPAPNTCGSFKEGDLCSSEGASCDLGNDCNQKLVCSRTDPKLQVGGCPISRPVYKQDIRLLGPIERSEKARVLENLQLAAWHYRFDPQGPERLGFLIDAHTPDELVKPDGNSVDLYGYMSLAVAAVQEQQDRVKSLEARLSKLEAALEKCGSK